MDPARALFHRVQSCGFPLWHLPIVLLQRCEEKVAIVVDGSTDKLWTETTMVLVHRLHVIGDLTPNLLVCDPLL
eukprot:12938675-Prorocentrum_lima.AAC.1